MRVAVVQTSAVYMDRAGSLEKAVAGIRRAAGEGAQLVCFGETFLPGYPAWLDFCEGAALWNHAATKEVFARLRENSVRVPGPETAVLSQLAGELGVGIVIGVNERVDGERGHGTLYNSLLTFGPGGTLLTHHRKLVPTYTERLVWGPGDAEGLRCADINGARVGGLVCWEHWMPLTRQHMHDQGEQIHIAVWPTVHEMHQVASRAYAFEGRCFVLAAGMLMSASDLPPELAGPALAPEHVLHGGSSIIAPDGRYLAGPVFDEETILHAELDLREIDRESMTLDVTGHYARPDVFQLTVRQDPRPQSRRSSKA